jgi:hypothetical protein
MKILCLILASDTTPEHIRFQELWRKFMYKHLDVDCYFYKGNPGLEREALLKGNTLWIKIPETLETVYEKTLRAFEFFLPRLEHYDFLYRTNVSTVTSFEHMIEYCKELPKTNCCAAVAGGVPYDKSSLECPNSFPGGNGFLLSTDLVRRLVEEKIPLIEQDDITIGFALRKWEIPIQQFVRPDLNEDGTWNVNNIELLKKEELTLNPKKIMFSYRLKTSDRNRDILTMERLIDLLYHD